MTRRPLVIASVAAVLALLLGVGVTSFVLYLQAKSAAAPESIAERYLTLVQRGDIEEAMRMEGRVVGPEDILLSDAVYAEATGRLDGFRIVRSEQDGSGRVTVEATTRVGGKDGRLTLSLVSAGWTPGELVGVTAWELRPVSLALIRVRVGAPAGVTATLAGHTLPDPSGLHTYSAFPGHYALSVQGDSEWFTIAGTSAAATSFGQGVEAQAAAELTEKGKGAAKAATDTWLQGCLQGGPQPEGCSFGLQAGAGAGEVWTNQRWDLDPAPQVTVAPWSFDCSVPNEGRGCWPVSTTTPGSAEFHADVSIPATGESGTVFSLEPSEVNVEGGITAFGEAGATFASIVWR